MANGGGGLIVIKNLEWTFYIYTHTHTEGTRSLLVEWAKKATGYKTELIIMQCALIGS